LKSLLIRQLTTIILLAISALCLEAPIAKSVYALPEIDSQTQEINQNIADLTLHQTARQVTVKVYVDQSGGSGFIIKKQTDQKGILYTVVTNDHVTSGGKQFKIQTHDGKLHPATLYKRINFANHDIAILQFRTKPNLNYPIARLAPSQKIKTGDPVYAAGFPYDINTGNSNQFRFSAGRFSLRAPQRLREGYQFGYTSRVRKGMSGGPVFNSNGQVIAINGVQPYPLTNFIYTYPNGRKPCNAMLAVMRASSFGIPMETFMALAAKPLNLKYDTLTSETSGSYYLDSLIEPDIQMEERRFAQQELSLDAITLKQEVTAARCAPP
jgi:serine protease Do